MKMIGVRRERAARLELARGLESVDARHHHVEDDDREFLLGAPRASASAPEFARTTCTSSGSSTASSATQVLRAVVDDQDARDAPRPEAESGGAGCWGVTRGDAWGARVAKHSTGTRFRIPRAPLSPYSRPPRRSGVPRPPMRVAAPVNGSEQPAVGDRLEQVRRQTHRVASAFSASRARAKHRSAHRQSLPEDAVEPHLGAVARDRPDEHEPAVHPQHLEPAGT